jgi:hypothetical protein
VPTNRLDEGMVYSCYMSGQDIDFLVNPHRAYILPRVRMVFKRLRCNGDSVGIPAA